MPPPLAAPPGVRPMKVLAAAWLLTAAGLGVLVGPSLGWRGWIWLGTHQLLCLTGAGWELWGDRLDPWFDRVNARLHRPPEVS